MNGLGPHKNCIATIEKFVSVGVEHFVLHPACSPPEMMSQFELFAAQVMPHFR